MMTLTEAIQRASDQDRTTYRPCLYRMAQADDRDRLKELLACSHTLHVTDTLRAQLAELVRTLHPGRNYDKAQLDEAIASHLNGVSQEEYGVWVHYPWSGRLVHLLDEQEFALLRTDRNRNKITRAEQAVLASKKVGVIGLSVGQSVALTLTLERAFGEIRLADHDTLDLSNLNRIRSGVHELGLPKVINTAREIAEIDPFLKVTIHPDGLNRTNMDAFFSDGGELDLLIEECDSVDIKVLARVKARQMGIPVVMDTSDRGMVDIERFDLEPDRPLLHGLLDKLGPIPSGQLSAQERLRYAAAILPIGQTSDGMRASVPEIGRTLSTWPQLASSVMVGGGTVANVVRRIQLGQPVPSGRWFVDPEAIIPTPIDLLINTPERLVP